MFKFFQRSIQFKVLAIEFAVLTVTFAFATYFEHQHRSEREFKAFAVRAEESIASIKQSLVLPIWNFANEDIDEILKSATTQPHIWQAIVYDAEGKLMSNALAAGQPPEDLSYKLKRPLIHKNNKIADLEIIYNSAAVIAVLRANLYSSIVRNAVSMFVILLATFLFLQRSILSKISRLSQHSTLMKNQNLDTPFNWSPGDELDALGEGLEATRQSLQQLIQSLGTKNQELNALTLNLEKLVAEKSTQVIHQSRLASLGELSASMAHEINNPLGIISSSSDVLKRFIKDNPNLEQRLDSIDRAVVRIEKIIGGLRKFSRSSGTIVLKTEPISAIIKEALQLCEAKSRRDMVPIDVEVSTENFIQCDPIEIEQVVVNLINNGIDAVKKNSNRWLQLKALDEGSEVVIRVIDSGNGIPLDIQEKLFQPFFTTKPVGEGTGLGLSIVKGIIDNHGAKLFVNNDFKNTCFEVRFAKAEPPAKKQTGAKDAA